jgi:hypothetical protein
VSTWIIPTSSSRVKDNENFLDKKFLISFWSVMFTVYSSFVCLSVTVGNWLYFIANLNRENMKLITEILAK